MSPLRQHHGISVDMEEKKSKLKGKTLSSVFWGGVFAKFFPQTHVFKHLEHLCELLCNIIVKNAVENWRDRTLVSLTQPRRPLAKHQVTKLKSDMTGRCHRM